MSPRRPPPAKATKSEQDAALGELRAFWRRGRELKRTRKSGESLKAWVQRQRLKDSTNTLYKLLEFAERIGTKRDLDDLLAVRTAAGMPLTWSHFTILMCLTDAKKRMKFARLAARKALSSASPRARIQAADPKGNRRQGSGRKPPANAPRAEAVLRIRRQIGRLRRQLEALPEVDGISQGRGHQILAQRQAELLTALAEFEAAATTHAGGQSRTARH